jgi:hypothetical protein
MEVVPAYRAESSITTLSGVRISLTVDSRIPQSGFNVDKADGTGNSGFQLDINKILMYYIDYAWYGAGTIRFGVKDQTGEIIYLHKFVHGNNKIEAYFRTGNLPLRYEVVNGSSSPSFAPLLFHWGTSLIMDGRFDDDRGYTFSRAGTLNTITTGNPYCLLNIRLAPTVDNGIPAGYGVRDLTNRMQLWSAGADVAATDSVIVSVILNGQLTSPAPTWVNVGGNSLAQYDDNATTVIGGETVYQVYTQPAPARQTYFNYFGQPITTGVNFGVTTFDLSKIKELNNAINGGFNTYPDGPDTISIVVQPLNANVTYTARASLRWQENQA